MLFKESDKARDELVLVDRRLLYVVYQYVGARCVLFLFMMVLKHFGFYTSFWLRVLVWVILFVFEVIFVACYGLLVVAPKIRMFLFYKAYKYAVWFQEFSSFYWASFLDVSKSAFSALYASIILEMIVVSLLQYR